MTDITPDAVPFELDRDLNLICRLDTRTNVWVPFPDRKLFDAQWQLFALTWARMTAQGMGISAGGAIAKRMLLEVAEEGSHTLQAGAKAIIGEIGRTARVVIPTDEGFEDLPLSVAQRQGHISMEDREEVENTVVFFMLITFMTKRSTRGGVMRLLSPLLGSVPSSSTLTAFKNTLMKLEAAKTGEADAEA